MAALTLTGGITNTVTRETLEKTRVAYTTTGDLEQAGVKAVGTSEETITIDADFTDNGPAIFICEDATNFIQLGYATGVYFARLYPGIANTFHIDSSVATLYVKADTAECDLRYKLHEG